MEKFYREPFALDESKLSRILQIVEQRMNMVTPLPEEKWSQTFEVTLANSKYFLLSDREAILELSNTVKNPIISLRLRAHSESPSNTDPSHGIDINFADRDYSNITFFVFSPNQRWAIETSAELEEQIERTFQDSLFFRTTTVPISLASATALLVIGVLVSLLSGVIFSRLNPPAPDATATGRLLREAATAETDSDKIAILFEARVAEMERSTRKVLQRPALWRASALALPVVIVGGIVLYTWLVCYPRAVFNWGDYGTHYQELVGRRRYLWNMVFATIVLGIVANLFVAALPGLR